jgi:hypothetical protein
VREAPWIEYRGQRWYLAPWSEGDGTIRLDAVCRELDLWVWTHGPVDTPERAWGLWRAALLNIRDATRVMLSTP